MNDPGMIIAALERQVEALSEGNRRAARENKAARDALQYLFGVLDRTENNLRAIETAKKIAHTHRSNA